MCGRYMIVGHQELSERLTVRQIRFPWPTTYNAAPSQLLPVVTLDDDERVAQLMRWGLVPPWTKPSQNPQGPADQRQGRDGA